MNCIFCHRPGCIPDGDRNFFCKNCRVTFDPEDDGDFTDRPDGRLLREESRREKEAARRATRSRRGH